MASLKLMTSAPESTMVPVEETPFGPVTVMEAPQRDPSPKRSEESPTTLSLAESIPVSPQAVVLSARDGTSRVRNCSVIRSGEKALLTHQMKYIELETRAEERRASQWKWRRKGERIHLRNSPWTGPSRLIGEARTTEEAAMARRREVTCIVI